MLPLIFTKPSIGCKGVIANIFVVNFRNQPSQHHKAIEPLRFKFRVRICFPIQTLFWKLWHCQWIAMLFGIRFQSLGCKLEPFFLVSAPPIATFCHQNANSRSAKVSTDPQMKNMEEINSQHPHWKSQKASQWRHHILGPWILRPQGPSPRGTRAHIAIAPVHISCSFCRIAPPANLQGAS